MKNKCNHIFAILAKNNPEPKTELNFTNKFTLLIAIILSAQSTDVGVNKATATLFKVVDTPSDLLALGENNLKSYIKTLGLFNNKARYLMELAKKLEGRELPTSLIELEKLPGVGSKTARVFLNCALGEAIIAVDTHVFRVSKRLGIAFGKNAKQVETELEQNIPAKWKLHAHHWLILHGRYICVARKPFCSTCPINKYCDYYLAKPQDT